MKARTMQRGAAAWAAAVALAAAAQTPGEHELELWRAAARLDTAAAYQAYLAAFPNGAFAAMSRAALAKLAPTEPPAAELPRPSTLPPFGGERGSGAVDLSIGARLTGPGVVSIGAFGSRRQLLLPAGEWILLAAGDQRAAGTTQITVDTLVFGQFAETQLRSLFVATFNRRNIAFAPGGPVTLQAMGVLPRWHAAEACEVPTAGDQLLEVATTRALRHCAAVRAAGDWRQALAGRPVLAALDEVLRGLGTAAPEFTTRSELQMTDVRYGMLGVLRLDGAAVGSAKQRAAWLRAYTPLAVQGYSRDLDVDDLRPGVPAPAGAGAIVLPY